MDPIDFDSIIPSRYETFSEEKPEDLNLKHFLHTERLRFGILDSPSYQPTDDPPEVGALLVPRYRENDWIFSTEEGICQLISSWPKISRLILVGNDLSELDNKFYKKPMNDNLGLIKQIEKCFRFHPLLVKLLPKRNRELERYEIQFVKYEDNVVRSLVLEGGTVDDFLVEDVEYRNLRLPPKEEYRRRLRFKRKPISVPSQINIVPMASKIDPTATNSSPLAIGSVKYVPDLSTLVRVYFPMAASLSLASAHFQNCFDSIKKPQVLYIGDSGGALAGFLATQLGFTVLVHVMDDVVLRVAMEHFGLQDYRSVKLYLLNGFNYLKMCAAHLVRNDFHAIMVDLDHGLTSSEFMEEAVLSAAKYCLSDAGVLVLNVIPKDELAYEEMKCMLKEVFVELYQIDLANEKHVVVTATKTSIDLSAKDCEVEFLTKLRSVVSSALIDSIHKI